MKLVHTLLEKTGTEYLFTTVRGAIYISWTCNNLRAWTTNFTIMQLDTLYGM